MLNSLKFKIAITAFLLISIIMAATTWRDIKENEQKFLNIHKEKAGLFSDRIVHGIMVLMLNNRWQDLQAMMEGLVKNGKELKEIRIFLPDNGTIVVSSEPKDIGKQIYKEDLQRFKKQKDQAAFLIEKNGQRYASKLAIIQNLPACHKCHNPEKKILGVLDIEISLSDVYESIREFKKKHLINALIGFFLITGAFMFVITLLIDRPIKKMIRTIRKIESGDLSARMKTDKKDELGILAKSFNSMVESLESAKKEIEQYHMQQIEKAARLASLGEIISGITHEIKNPLSGISCAIQVFHSELSEDDSRKAVTAEILNQVKRLDRIVKDLLSYAKPKPPQFLPFKIKDGIEKATFFVYPEAKKQNVVIDTGIEKDIPDMMMDPDQMQQVLLNFMINAVQAMPAGGKLKISVSQKNYQEVRDEIKRPLDTDKTLVISFQDTGRGIAPEDLEKIFEPFFTRKPKGTGLGLSISQRIIHDHGGEITVRSEVGRGAVFTIYLPIK